MGKGKDGGLSASWESQDILLFCDLCIREIELGNRPTTHFSKEGWKNLVTTFKQRTGKNYDRLQMKNKWDHLKKEWKTWKELKLGATGLGWDPEKKTIAAPDQWWEDKIKVIPAVRKFRYAGISPELEDKLDRMFGEVVAAGEDSWGPSMRNIPAEEENVHVEDDMGTHTPGRDVGAGNTSNTLANASATSVGKRRKITKNKGVSASYISELRETAISMKPPPVVSIKEAVDLLSTIPEIYDDYAMYFYAVNYVKDRSNREVFMSIPADRRLWWIRNSYTNQ